MRQVDGAKVTRLTMREMHRGYTRECELSARSWSMYPPLQAAILPAGAGFLGSDGYLPDNGLVSWDVDAVAECPISGGYQMFASSQTAGNADRFSPAAPHLPTIRSSGRRHRCVRRRHAARTPRGRPHNGTDFRLQAWCNGRPHSVPEPGPHGPLPVNSGMVSAVDRRARGAWTPSRARL
jgi:hypothetical protein